MLQGCPTMQRLAAVNGLVALVGSETGILQVSLPTFGMGLVESNLKVQCCTVQIQKVILPNEQFQNFPLDRAKHLFMALHVQW